MANQLQRATISLLGTKDEAAAIIALADAFGGAFRGDVDRASAALAISAEIFKQGRAFPEIFVPFLTYALELLSHSLDACQVVAGTSGKRGRRSNEVRDRAIVREELNLRPQHKLKKARLTILAQQFNLSPEAVNTVLKEAKAQERRNALLLLHADELIASGGG